MFFEIIYAKLKKNKHLSLWVYGMRCLLTKDEAVCNI